MIVTEPQPISTRFFGQEDRIASADGLRVGLSRKQIATQLGKLFQSFHREIARNSKPDGSYQPRVPTCSDAPRNEPKPGMD